MIERFLPQRFHRIGPLRGQVVVLFALSLPALIGLLGIGLDAAALFNARRDAQSATDLAALAGASQLPDDLSAASSVAMGIAAANGYSDGVTVTAPYGNDDTQIEVAVSQDVGLIFMPLFGLESVSLSARSVASHEINAGNAVFNKKDSHCWEGTFTLGASNVTIDGSVHSNGGMTISGNNNTVTGDITYKNGQPAYPLDNWTNCEPDVRLTGNNPNIDVEAGPWSDWPLFYTRSNFSCTYDIGSTGGNIHDPGPWWVGGSMNANHELRPGVYCLSGNGYLDLQGADDVEGNVTLVAKKIRVEGDDMQLSAYQNGVLFFSDADNEWPAIDLRPRDGKFEGIIFADYGEVRITGSNGFQQVGSIVAWATRLYGSGYSIFGTEASTPDPMRLVE